MDEEFEESGIFWPDPDFSHSKARSLQCLRSNAGAKIRKESPAVDVQTIRADQNSYHRTRGSADTNIKGSVVDDEDGGSVKTMIPPHVLMARRREEEMVAHSVCDGDGRTLKGRDLRRVRDAVLRMTGFLER